MSDEMESLLRSAGERRTVPRERSDRVRRVARDIWRAEVRRRTLRRRVHVGGAIAASLVLAAALAVLLREAPSTSPSPIFVVELVAGAATEGARSPLATGSRLSVGSEVRTGEGSRIALRLPSGASVRVDDLSAIRLLGPDEVALDRGAVYVDSGTGAPALVVRTPLGEVHEIGTRFEVRLHDGGLRVRLREGSVSVRRGRVSHEVPSGEELLWDAEGGVARRALAPHDPAWDWTAAIAPRLDLEGRTAREILEWVARERGLALVYADAAVERAASETVLAAGPADLSPDEALPAVLPACRLAYRISESGVLEVSAEARPSGPPSR